MYIHIDAQMDACLHAHIYIHIEYWYVHMHHDSIQGRASGLLARKLLSGLPAAGWRQGVLQQDHGGRALGKPRQLAETFLRCRGLKK